MRPIAVLAILLFPKLVLAACRVNGKEVPCGEFAATVLIPLILIVLAILLFSWWIRRGRRTVFASLAERHGLFIKRSLPQEQERILRGFILLPSSVTSDRSKVGFTFLNLATSPDANAFVFDLLLTWRFAGSVKIERHSGVCFCDTNRALAHAFLEPRALGMMRKNQFWKSSAYQPIEQGVGSRVLSKYRIYASQPQSTQGLLNDALGNALSSLPDYRLEFKETAFVVLWPGAGFCPALKIEELYSDAKRISESLSR